MRDSILSVMHCARGPRGVAPTRALCLAQTRLEKAIQRACEPFAAVMAEPPNDFFPATSTVGKTFGVPEGSGFKEGGVDDVSSMGGDYRNMKLLGYKVGVMLAVANRPPLPPKC